MDTPNCEKCRYRYWLAHDFDVHVDMHDCDQRGSVLCKKMNDPDFIKFMEGENNARE